MSMLAQQCVNMIGQIQRMKSCAEPESDEQSKTGTTFRFSRISCAFSRVKLNQSSSKAYQGSLGQYYFDD